MTIEEIFDCSYTSQTKSFEILDSNKSRPMFFNLLVFWSSIIVITCLLQCFGWTWSYFILILETWPRVFGSLDVNNDEEEN